MASPQPTAGAGETTITFAPVPGADVALHRELAASFHEQFKGLYPGVSTTDDAREILETINPWQRQEDHDRFFGALEKAGVFGEQHGQKDLQRLSLVR